MTTATDFFLQNFISTFKGGARPNQFVVDLAFPAALAGNITSSTQAASQLKFFAKGSALPRSSVGIAPAPFRGRVFKLVGDREYDAWTITCYNDVDNLLRTALEQWQDNCVGFVNADTFGDGANPLDLMASGNVHQMNKNGDYLKSYLFVGVWPTEISQIRLDWEANNQVEVFDVTLAVQWVEPDGVMEPTDATEFTQVTTPNSVTAIGAGS